MNNPSKARGTAWETAIVNYVNDATEFDAYRKPLKGADDEGDIGLWACRWLTIEAKAAKKHALAAWVDEANTEADNAQVPVGVVWAKRRGKTSPADGYVIMDGVTFTELLCTITGLEEALREGPQ